MNLYFLVEGSKTEPIVYSSWIKWLAGNDFVQVNGISQLNKTQNSYYIIGANGYPGILDNLLPTSLSEIIDTNLIDHFIVVFDLDESTIEQRVIRALTKIADYCNPDNRIINCQVHIIIQNVCIETWFLGNNEFCSIPNSNVNCKKHKDHYDVCLLDPELMPKRADFKNLQKYHFAYFTEFCNLKRIEGQSYSKSNPSIVCTPQFLQGIINRINQTDHLNSFRYFHQVISNL